MPIFSAPLLHPLISLIFLWTIEDVPNPLQAPPTCLRFFHPSDPLPNEVQVYSLQLELVVHACHPSYQDKVEAESG